MEEIESLIFKYLTMSKPKILVFASGTSYGGGSGFENLVESTKNDILHAEIVGVVSNHCFGGVRMKADILGIPFIHFPSPWTENQYHKIADDSGADFFALSGWLKQVVGLDLTTKFNQRTVFNIHPGPLPKFGGKNFYGHHVHEAVIKSFEKGEITETEINMHFVDEKIDEGLIFAKIKIPINDDENSETLAKRVLHYEHLYQPRITNLVVNGMISWDGVNANSLEIPEHYSVLQ